MPVAAVPSNTVSTTAATTVRPPRDVKRIIVITVGLLLALNFVVIGYHATRDTTATPDLPSGIAELFPPRGQVVRPQDELGVQLQKGWTGELTLDTTPLPKDQYDPVALENNAIFWRPGPGKEFSETPPGKHTLSLHYWPVEEGSGGPDDHTFTWDFKVG